MGWRTSPKNCPSCGDLDLHLIYGSVGSQESAPKQHLDRLSRFAQLTHVPNTLTTLRAGDAA